MRVFAPVVVCNHTNVITINCTCMRNKYPCKSELCTYIFEGDQFLNSQHA